MHVTRQEEARTYESKHHHDTCTLRLQGWDTGPTQTFWTGLSYFFPRGGADFEASAVERVYVVLDGEVTILTEGGEFTLKRLDSCHIPANERRAVENRGNTVATMLVIGQYPPGTAR